MTKKALFSTSLLLLLLDQATKRYITIQNLPHQQNTGLFFSNLPLPLLITLSIIILLILFSYLLKTIKQKNKYLTLALSLIFIGGLSNFLDRLILKHVIDWIYLPFFPFSVLNLADIYITIGLLFSVFTERKQT